jgi:hypothetical protein
VPSQGDRTVGIYHGRRANASTDRRAFPEAPAPSRRGRNGRPRLAGPTDLAPVALLAGAPAPPLECPGPLARWEERRWRASRSSSDCC